MEKNYKNAVKLFLVAFPYYRETERFKNDIDTFPDFENFPYPIYGGFDRVVVEPLLKGEKVDGFTLEKIVSFTNKIFNDPTATEGIIGILNDAWLSTFEAGLSPDSVFPEYKKELLDYVWNNLKGKAREELEWLLGKRKQPPTFLKDKEMEEEKRKMIEKLKNKPGS